PIETAFSRYVFDPPSSGCFHELIVTFRYLEHFIDRCHAFARNPLIANKGSECKSEGVPQAFSPIQQLVRSLRVRLREGQKLLRTLRGDDPRRSQKPNQLFPAQVSGLT